MPDRRESPYTLLAALTSLGIVLVLPAFLVDDLSTAGRWVLAAAVACLAGIVAFCLWRARQGRVVPRPMPDGMVNVALAMGVLGAVQLLPVAGSLTAIVIAGYDGRTRGPEQPARPRRIVLAEALGWVGLAIFAVSVVVYFLR